MIRHRIAIAAAIALAVAAALVGLYAALGYWYAPGFIRGAVVDRGREAGFDVRVDKVSTHPFALSVELDGLRISTLKGEPLLNAQALAADLSAASLFSHAWVVQRVAVEHPVLTAVPAVSHGGSGRAAPPRLEVREASITGGAVQLAGEPRLSNIALTLHDLSTFGGQPAAYEAAADLDPDGHLRSKSNLPANTRAAQGNLELDGAALASAWRFLPRSMGESPQATIDASTFYRLAEGRLSLNEFHANGTMKSGGTLRAIGAMQLAPFSATLQIEARKLPLALVKPLAEDLAAVRIDSGAVSGKGDLQLGGKGPGYRGSLSVSDTRLVDSNGKLLLGWKTLETGQLEVQFSPFSLHIEDVSATGARARVAIDEKGRLNLAQVLAHGGGGAGSRPQVHVQRLRIAKGRVDFNDRSLATPFGTTLRELDGTVAGISTAPGEAARVRLDGRVGQYGEARVRGTVDLDAPTELTNVSMRLSNLALPDFTPYAAKFAGYRIKAGRLDAELRYRVNAGRLVGSNQLVFRDLELGEKVESASALDVPVELAVALLTDSQGRIDLAIPVSGNLNDPHFDAGGLVAKALGTALRRIVSAPFRLLASLVHGDQDDAPGAVPFDAGSAQLRPPEEETVATLAKALAERPRVEVAIHAGYDAQADAQALRRQKLLGERAARTGHARAAAGSGAADSRRPGFGRRLLDRLASSIALDPAALPLLAQSRAQAVRQALIEHGADADRVAIDSARQVSAGKGGVPTAFELRPR